MPDKEQLIVLKAIFEDHVSGAMRRMGRNIQGLAKQFSYQVQLSDRTWATFSGRIGKNGQAYIKTVRAMTRRTAPFHFEMLSLMFVSMQLNRIFKDMLRPALDMTGVFETWGAVLGVTMLPALMPLVELFYLFTDKMLELSPTTQALIGILVILGTVLTGSIFWIAQFIMLLANWGAVMATLSAAGTALVGAISAIALPLVVLIGLLAFFYLAWTRDWGGIRTKTLEFVKDLREMLGNFIGWLKRLWDDPKKTLLETWESIKESARKVWQGILDTISEKVNAIKAKLKEIADATGISKVGGALAGAYNWVKEGIKGLVGGGFMSSPYTTTGGTVYEGIHQAQGLYDLNASRAGNNLTYAPIINITASISSDMDLRRIADRLDSMMQDRMRKYVRGT